MEQSIAKYEKPMLYNDKDNEKEEEEFIEEVKAITNSIFDEDLVMSEVADVSVSENKKEEVLKKKLMSYFESSIKSEINKNDETTEKSKDKKVQKAQTKSSKQLKLKDTENKDKELKKKKKDISEMKMKK